MLPLELTGTLTKLKALNGAKDAVFEAVDIELETMMLEQ